MAPESDQANPILGRLVSMLSTRFELCALDQSLGRLVHEREG